MDASQERVFHYHADANALGGVLTHPYKTVITTAANSSAGQCRRIQQFADSAFPSGPCPLLQGGLYPHHRG